MIVNKSEIEVIKTLCLHFLETLHQEQLMDLQELESEVQTMLVKTQKELEKCATH